MFTIMNRSKVLGYLSARCSPAGDFGLDIVLIFSCSSAPTGRERIQPVHAILEFEGEARFETPWSRDLSDLRSHAIGT